MEGYSQVSPEGQIIGDVNGDAAALAVWACGGDESTEMGRRWRSVHAGSCKDFSEIEWGESKSKTYIGLCPPFGVGVMSTCGADEAVCLRTRRASSGRGDRRTIARTAVEKMLRSILCLD